MIMRTLDAIIVDDEPAARRDLQQVLATMENVRVVGQASDAAAAGELARRHRPQLVFMDIQLPGADGFSAVEGLADANTCVVFTTAYAQYAVRAFEVGAVDYLLKPVDEQRCRRAIERAREQLERARIPGPQPIVEVEERGSKIRLPLAEIRIVTASGNYLEVEHDGRTGLIRQTLESFLAGSAKDEFVQTSRGQAVRISAVRSYGAAGGGGLQLRLADGREVSASRRRTAEVNAALRDSVQARPTDA